MTLLFDVIGTIVVGTVAIDVAVPGTEVSFDRLKSAEGTTPGTEGTAPGTAGTAGTAGSGGTESYCLLPHQAPTIGADVELRVHILLSVRATRFSCRNKADLQMTGHARVENILS